MAPICQTVMELTPSSRRKFHINKHAVNRNNGQNKNANKHCNFTDIIFHQVNLGRRKLAMLNIAQTVSKKPFICLVQEQHLLKNKKNQVI